MITHTCPCRCIQVYLSGRHGLRIKRQCEEAVFSPAGVAEVELLIAYLSCASLCVVQSISVCAVVQSLNHTLYWINDSFHHCIGAAAAAAAAWRAASRRCTTSSRLASFACDPSRMSLTVTHRDDSSSSPTMTAAPAPNLEAACRAAQMGSVAIASDAEVVIDFCAESS